MYFLGHLLFSMRTVSLAGNIYFCVPDDTGDENVQSNPSQLLQITIIMSLKDKNEPVIKKLTFLSHNHSLYAYFYSHSSIKCTLRLIQQGPGIYNAHSLSPYLSLSQSLKQRECKYTLQHTQIFYFFILSSLQDDTKIQVLITLIYFF